MGKINNTHKLKNERLLNNPDYRCLMRYYQRYDNMVEEERIARKKGIAIDIMRTTTMRIRLQELIKELEEKLDYSRGELY